MSKPSWVREPRSGFGFLSHKKSAKIASRSLSKPSSTVLNHSGEEDERIFISVSCSFHQRFFRTFIEQGLAQVELIMSDFLFAYEMPAPSHKYFAAHTALKRRNILVRACVSHAARTAEFDE